MARVATLKGRPEAAGVPAVLVPADPKAKTRVVVIKPPRTETATIRVIGNAPYVQNRFSSENRLAVETKQREGSSQARTRKAKPAKDFKKVYEGSRHVSEEGWDGIPCKAFRDAMIDACRSVEFDMVRARMFIRIIADGHDREDHSPLVKIAKGKPEMQIDPVRIGMGKMDLASRAVFKVWECDVRIEWDADVFQPADIANLLARAGKYVGVGAGRPLSKTSSGMGWGTFDIRV